MRGIALRAVLLLVAVLVCWPGALRAEGVNLRWRYPTLQASAFAVSPDGSLFAVATGFGGINLHRLADWSVTRQLPGHAGGVRQLAFSADGKLLISTGSDYAAEGGLQPAMKVWQVDNGEMLGQYPCQGDGLAVSPRGMVAVNGGDGQVAFWDLAAGKQVGTLAAPDTAYILAFSPDGGLLAAASEKIVLVWDMRTGRPLYTLGGHTDHINAVAFSPDGRYLATASDDATGKVWNAVDGRLVRDLDGNQAALYGLAFSPDGLRLATVTGDAQLSLWSLGADTPPQQTETGAGTLGVAFSRDGRMLFLPQNDRIEVRRSDTGEVTKIISDDYLADQTAVAFSPDGTLVAAGGGHTVCLWGVGDGACQHQMVLPDEAQVQSVAFSPDGKLLAAAAGTNVFIWRVGEEKPLLTIPADTVWVQAVAFSPDGAMLASGGADYNEQNQPAPVAHLWSVKDGAALGALSMEGAGSVWSLAFSPDGAVLAMGSEDSGQVAVTRLADGAKAGALPEQNGGANTIAFLPQGGIFATSTRKGTVALWSLQDLAPRGTLAGSGSLAISADGRYLAGGGVLANGPFTLWRLADGAKVADLIGNTTAIHCLALSADGKHLAMAGMDGLALWEIGE